MSRWGAIPVSGSFVSIEKTDHQISPGGRGGRVTNFLLLTQFVYEICKKITRGES